MSQRRLDIARELLSLPTAPLYEAAVSQWLTAFAHERGLDAREDRCGNIFIRYSRGRRSVRPLVIAAHMDHPGFGAVRMLDRATLLAYWRGGVPPQLFEGAKVRFWSEGRQVRGRVVSAGKAAKPGFPMQTLVRVDAPVAPGSAGMWDFPQPRLRGTLLTARGHDDVIGVAAIAVMLDEACRKRMDGDFHALFTRCEEGGFWGAIGASKAKSLPRKAVIVALEASREMPNARPGDGVVVRVGDRTSIFSPWVSAALTQAAAKLAAAGKGFRFVRRLMDGGTCESTVYGAYGYDAGGLCLPLRNYHNVNWDKMKLAAEQVDTRDFESLVALLMHLGEHGLAKPSAAAAREPFEERFARQHVSPVEHVALPRGCGIAGRKRPAREIEHL